MPGDRIAAFVQRLRVALAPPGAVDQGDAQLLDRFVRLRDEAAFGILVRRHGPMVWGVCRRVVRRYEDAEDAFQATFLVLIRKAASIQSRALLAGWLHGVARRTALKASASAAIRGSREKPLASAPEPEARNGQARDELHGLLDAELDRLPEKYRVLLVLCDLQGKTRREAAHLLGVPEGTVAGRLVRARALLGRRLTSHRAGLGGGALALTAPAAPSAVVSATMRSAIQVVPGTVVVDGIPPRVADLTKGVLRAMMMTRLKATLGTCLMLGLVAALVGAVNFCPAAPARPAELRAERAGETFKDTLLLLDQHFWEAAARGDAATTGKILADDFEGLDDTGAGFHWTKATLLEMHSAYRIADFQRTMAPQVFRINEHAAVMTNDAKFRGLNQEGAEISRVHQRFVTCWAQRDGGWFIVFSRVTNLPMSVAPAKPPTGTKFDLNPDLRLPTGTRFDLGSGIVPDEGLGKAIRP